MVAIASYPRVHLGLFNLGDRGLPAFGGMGFAVDSAPTVVATYPASRFTLDLCDHYPEGADSGLRGAVARFDRQYGLPEATVTIESHPPRHSGLGTGTAAVLAVVDCLARESQLDLSAAELQKLSGRGGASGVGVNTYFVGGFIVDGGHRQGANGYLPSSQVAPAEPAPVLVRAEMPSSWRIALLLPKHGRRMSGDDEVEFFSEALPLPREEVWSAISLAYQSVVRAVLTEDLMSLRKALEEFCGVGFKKREINNQSPAVTDLLAIVREDTDLASTMSSLGPLVVGIGHEADSASFERLKALGEHMEFDMFEMAKGRNSGAEVLGD